MTSQTWRAYILTHITTWRIRCAGWKHFSVQLTGNWQWLFSVLCTQTCVTAENQQRKQYGVFFGLFPNNTGEGRDYLLTNKRPFSDTWQLQTLPQPPFLLILHKASHVGIHCNIQEEFAHLRILDGYWVLKQVWHVIIPLFMPFFKDSDLVKIQHWFSRGNFLNHNYSLQIVRQVYEEIISPR